MSRRSRNRSTEYTARHDYTAPEAEPVGYFWQNTPAEEPVEIVEEIPTITEAEPVTVEEELKSPNKDLASIAMNVIAGSYGTTEEEIREKLAEDGYSFEEITDVKKQILNGTYYK